MILLPSHIHFKEEDVPSSSTTSFWDRPHGTRGFVYCPRKDQFILFGQKHGEPEGIIQRQTAECGTECVMVVIENPIYFVLGENLDPYSCELYADILSGCLMNSGVCYSEDDPNYATVLAFIKQYTLGVNDIEFHIKKV